MNPYLTSLVANIHTARPIADATLGDRVPADALIVISAIEAPDPVQDALDALDGRRELTLTEYRANGAATFYA